MGAIPSFDVGGIALPIKRFAFYLVLLSLYTISRGSHMLRFFSKFDFDTVLCRIARATTGGLGSTELWLTLEHILLVLLQRF